MSNEKVPDRLYKYRSFDARSFAMILQDKVFLSDPRLFNDPLDAKPNLEVDVSSNDLEEILKILFWQREKKELSITSKRMKGIDADTASLDKLVGERWEKQLDNLKFWVSLGENEAKALEDTLKSSIEAELLKRYSKGILSLAERDTCPLMWSHYGDQHQGVCLGYSIPASQIQNVRKVTYGGPRTIAATRVQSMLKGNRTAENAVDFAALLTKAEDWKYEREWRLIASKGETPSMLELEEIVFGLRFPRELSRAVMKSMIGREREVKFFFISETPDSFVLRKVPLNIDDEVKWPAQRSGNLKNNVLF